MNDTLNEDASADKGVARPLTSDEIKVLQALAEAWNCFVRLEQRHPADRHEFEAAIHQAQNIVFARPAFEALARRQVTDVIGARRR
jgi:hypothetical protein